jgi:hypothetical protein
LSLNQAPENGGAAEGAPAVAPKSRLWPIAITVGLIFVILVNLAFIYIAVTGADEVMPSYFTEPR